MRHRPSSQSVLIAGCGDLGGRLGLRLAAEGRQVSGLRRNVDKLPAGIGHLRGDLGAGELPELREVDAVVYIASADGFADDSYRCAYVDGVRHLLAALTSSRLPRRWLHVSSTSVYAQSGGEEVDEASPAGSEHFAGRRLLEGEELLRSAAAEHGFAASVLRFGGIYGPERTRLLDSVRDGSARIHEPDTWTNRIHVDDCVGTLAHLLDLESPAELYLGVDSEPAPDGEVKRWLASRLGVPEPAVVDSLPGAASRGLRSNKRCRNRRLLASGYEFRFPDFRSGYDAILGAYGR